MKEKIIFLDVDGVLNWGMTEDRIDGCIGMCADRIARFNRIFEAHPDAKIVVSSTWRHAYRKGMEDFVPLLRERGITADVIGATPRMFSQGSRGGEIRRWLEKAQNEGRDLEYVILDDETDGMEGYENAEDLRSHHVVTFWYGSDDPEGKAVEGGLQDSHIETAIGVLNGERVPVKKRYWEP